MMRLYSGEHWSVFVEAQISPFIIFLTAGELGIPKNSTLEPHEMACIRKNEAYNAMTFLHASYTFLNYSDLSLSFVPLENLVTTVLPLIRTHHTDALFSFHPHETTTSFDHPDHNMAGLVTKYVSAAADVANFMPSYQALPKRPELYLWTTQQNQDTYNILLNDMTRTKRNNYLINYYPSQFPASAEDKWSKIFHSITYSSESHHQECYVKVR